MLGTRSVCRWLRDDRGVTSMEYGLLGVLIAVAVAVSVAGIGTEVGTLFTKVVSCFPSGNC